ncbi:hypothetical protein L8Y18_03975 [Campylobacter sp. CNRCH_2007_0968H]|uniref:hypothetical protein n=1 Tax=Campylobacter sp. CNRCH_2007_0968H TaxID=2911598 RepID=UPI0021E649E8|nr:hypothetical protein [Campylobacter sp. CNRCH_2007_0968H]MCV3530603.1 hypothetical protein [Campylobacter sp. CNRCH_2007_0968H]
MLKKLASSLILGSLLVSSAFAGDFLAKVSNGALSDNSQGVKVLNVDEMKQVKGGYQTSFKLVGNNELLAFSKPSWTSELTLFQDSNGDQYYWNREGLVRFGGMCGIDTTNCLVNGKHTYTNQQRLLETMSIVGNDPYHNFIGYTVKRNIGVSNLGKRFVYFSYGVAVINEQLGSWYRVKSSTVLNNYKVIKEISSKYKNDMELALGGYSIK